MLSKSAIKKVTTGKIFRLVNEISRRDNTEMYVIGGWVRDLILKRNSKDVDIVVVGNGIDLACEVAQKLGKNKRVTVFKNFGTAMLQYRGTDYEFVGARRESYNRNSRKPVVENGTLADDQLRRDFTINAIAIGLGYNNLGKLIDPFNGLDDIKNKIIRTPADPSVTFSDDPLRMLRAVRFASQLGFTIHPEAYQAIKDNVYRLKIISKERIADELNKIMLSPAPSVGFKILSSTGLLKEILPELEALKGIEDINGQKHKDNFYHTLEVVDNISKHSQNLWLRWAALLHDIGKTTSKRYHPNTGWTFHGHEITGSKIIPSIFKSLKLPLDNKLKYVQKMVSLHMRPIVLAQDEVTDSAVRRLLFDAADDIDDLMMLCDADITSKNPEKVKRLLKNYQIVRQKMIDVEQKDKIRNWQPPVTGLDITQTFGIEPGKNVGIIKNAIRDAILDGKIPNSYHEAFLFMLEKGKELGLKPVKKNTE